MSTTAHAGAAAASTHLPLRLAVWVFLVFAASYFLSALIRAVTATLAPTLSLELDLQASDLGLLAGGYFLGFAATQLPLGRWLDRHGPKKVILVFLALAVLGALAFAAADSFEGLLAARVLTGAGVSACLMAPLTGYRRWLSPALQLRANSWMLMTGSLGMVAATLPVQWLMPLVGWRGLFVLLALMLLVCMVLLWWVVPRWVMAQPTPAAHTGTPESVGYAQVWRHPYFRKMAGIGFFNYGGMVAIQTLWAGPWMVQVVGLTPGQSAQGLFWINVSMLSVFWLWGWLMPSITRKGIKVETLIAWGLPLSFVAMGLNIVLGDQATWPFWAAFCVLSTFVSLSQPAVALAFPASMAGRALSAFNLVIFAGVFVVQWGIGLLVDLFAALGLAQVGQFQAAMAVYLMICIACYAYFLSVRAHNRIS
jgi:MFS family permease